MDHRTVVSFQLINQLGLFQLIDKGRHLVAGK